jgi:transcriptional regulator with XRE-family HTH domain
MKRHKSLAQRLEDYPPFLVFCSTLVKKPRMSAAEEKRRIQLSNRRRSKKWRRWWNKRRKKARYVNYRRISREEIAARSGLSVATVTAISQKVTWDSVEVRTMLAFLKGCDFDPIRCCYLKLRLQRSLKRRKPLCLTAAQLREFKKRVRECEAYLGVKRTSNSMREKQASQPTAGEPSALEMTSS